MYRQSISQSLKQLPRRATRIAPPQRRFLSTATSPHQRSRSWKSSAARWGLAIGAVYFYNTSPVFAEEPSALLHADLDEDNEENLPSIDSKGSSVLASAASPLSPPTEHHRSESPNAAANPTELEEEAANEGAFNPITGEINWDCPCLGGMAHGPCGEEFKAAFSCFVYSTEEPKGMDCIDRFQGMQECFRAHPDIYRGELEDDEVPDEEMDAVMREEKMKLDQEVMDRRAAIEEAPQKRLLDDIPAQPLQKITPAPSASSSNPPSQQPAMISQTPQQQSPPSPNEASPSQEDLHPSHPTIQAAKAAKEDMKKKTESKIFDEDLELMPKAWHDQRDAKPESEKGKGTEK